MIQETPPPTFARPRVAAGALFVDAQGRVLLVRPTYKRHWDIPGGYVEPGESPRDACIREVREEIGLSIPKILPLLVVDWAPNDAEGDKLLFIFDGGPLRRDEITSINLSVAEVDEWKLVLPDDIEPYLTDRLSRRIHTAIAARSQGRALYAEHGTST